MELLRIVAMLFVVVLHINVERMGDGRYSYYLIESLSIVSVNAFILLSGWYSIRLSLKKLCSLLFQVFFFSCLFLFIQLIVGGGTVDISKEVIDIITLRQYWFVRAYILLMILSPALNAFSEKVNKQQFRLVLILFFVFQTLFSYINNSPWYGDGFSPMPFLGLYLLARYLRLHVSKIPNRLVSLSLYLGIAVFMATTAFLLNSNFGTQGRMFNYTNPILIISSVFFFLLFVSSSSFHSRFINWVASSIFAVYIFQMNPYFLNNHFLKIVKSWGDDSFFVFEVKSLILILAITITALLLDKIRFILWDSLSRVIWKESRVATSGH